jgi:2-polyprenyl-3-methyl-5-hydroxy-6-metoxy-1,4-benzoquinol methylase
MTEAIEYHEREARNFKDKYLVKESFKSRLLLWEQLIRNAGPSFTKSMDLGCGPGWMTSVLCEVSENVVAIDGSEQMIAQSKVTLGPRAVKVEFYNNTISPELFALWPEESFDLIISSSVLEYVDNAEGVLKKCFEVLALNGTLIFSIPNRESLFRMLEGSLFRLIGRPEYRGLLKNVWSRKYTASVLEEIGFKMDSVQYQGYIPWYSTVFSWLPDRLQKPMMIITAKRIAVN